MSEQDEIREKYLETLSSLPPVSESRLVLLDRMAKDRARLVEQVELLDFHAFTELASGQIPKESKNLSRVFGRLREQYAILSVEWQGKTLYPALQIEPETLKVYESLTPLLKEASDQGYTGWDVLKWLMTEQVLAEPPEPGTPIECDSTEDLLEELEKLHDSGNFREAYLPISLLQQRKIDVFQQISHQWLSRK